LSNFNQLEFSQKTLAKPPKYRILKKSTWSQVVPLGQMGTWGDMTQQSDLSKLFKHSYKQHISHHSGQAAFAGWSRTEWV
jgi:hypothetical protein